MNNVLAMNNSAALFSALMYVFENGQIIKPRGDVIREIRDFQIRMHPQFPFNPFVERKYNVDYFKTEMRWKLGASKFDASIIEHAKIWKSVQNPDGSFNSNYGQYWFGQQMGLMKAVLELIRDKDSRRATIPMLRDDHLSPETRDTVCTEAITFHIRNDMLHASIHMRSSDMIFGLGTDIPTFAVLMHLAHGLLIANYPELKIGIMTITAASSHIYERHFRMVDNIINQGLSSVNEAIKLPLCSGPAEANRIIADRGFKNRLNYVDSQHNLYNFIYGV